MIFWPSCNCCARCAILTEISLGLQTHWETLVESWDAVTGVLAGDGATAITALSASVAQYFRATVTANEPGQVLDILLGCDEAGVADITVRLTFGDSSVEDDCGSIELLDENGDPFEDPQPVLGLVDGVSTRVTLFTDAAIAMMFVEVRTSNPFDSITPEATATALITDDPSGRLGLRLVDSQGGDVSINVTIWDRMETSDETCHPNDICGTLIETTHPDGLVAGSTCVHTVGSLFYFGLNPVGVSSVDSHAIISARDRGLGYGIYAFGSALLSSADETTQEVYFDNGHHVVRLAISPRIAGACPGFSSTAYHSDLLLEVEKDGSVIASVTGCVGFGFSGPELFEFWITLDFCAGLMFARADVIISPGVWFAFISLNDVATSQVGDGSAHGASVNRGGIASLEVTRCCPE